MKNRSFICGILLPLFLLVWNPSQSQEFISDIEEYGPHNGFNFGVVLTMFETENGLLWLGTSKGLVRFDGQSFKLWNKHDNRLLFNVGLIREDDEGILWVYNETVYDFVFFEPNEEKFISKKDKFGDSFPPILTNKTKFGIDSHYATKKIYDSSIIFDTKGYDYIYKYHSSTGFTKIPKPKDVFAIREINDFIWYESLENYLVKCDYELKEINRFKLEDYWVSYRLHKTNGEHLVTTKKYAIDALFRPSKLYKIEEDETSLILTSEVTASGCTDSKLLIFLLKDKWLFRNYENEVKITLDADDFGNDNMLLNSDIFVDSKQNIWVFGHFGLVSISIFENRFERILSSKNKNSEGVATRGIYVDDNNYYIACEFSKGVKIINKENNEEIAVISKVPWPKPVLSISDNEILYGRYQLDKYNISTKEITTYATSPADESLWGSGHGVWSLYQDKKKNVWAGVGDYLAVKRSGSDSLRYHEASSIFKVKNVSSIIQNIIPEGKDSLWLCSMSGLYLFDLNTEKIIAEYNQNQEGEYYLPAETFYYLHKDGDKYWLGTRSGLIEWAGPENSQNYKVFTSREKLSNDVIYAIIEDDYDRLWLSSDYGIMAFDKNDHTISVYLEKDGIAHYECNRISQFKDKDGFIYFGGLNGVTKFHPRNFVAKEEDNPSLILTGFEVFDGKQGAVIDKKGEVLATKTFHFNPSDRFFRVQFTLPIYKDVSRTTYAWKIDGIDEDWNYQKENSIQIGMLPYGKHNLRIKGKNANGSKSKNDLELSIEVHKPFYMKWWFILLSIGSFIGAGVLYYLNRTRVLKNEIEKATQQIQNDKQIIENQAEELKKLDKLKSQFFANVSHELRTPLSLMLGPINKLIKDNGHDPKEKKLLSFLHKNTLHLRNLVNEILDLSKLENNKMELVESPVSLKKYLTNHLNQFYSFGDSERVAVRAELDIEDDLIIDLDQNKFEKIINNYLSNAIKYSPVGGKVLFNTKLEGQNLIVSVKDEGSGISSDDLPFIFDRFYQSKNENAPAEGGTGIGLSICSELVGLMNGKVWAESALGVGSIFYASIPVKVSEITEGSTITTVDEYTLKEELELIAPIVSEDDSKYTILVVEDNEDLREYYKIILEGYSLKLTANGKEAIDYLSVNDNPDLILSDLMMPVMDGMQLLSKLKSSDKYCRLPFIMLTAKTNRDIKIKALRHGIDDYITKPFDEEELKVRIQNLLAYKLNREIKISDEKDSKVKISQEDMKWLEDFEEFVLAHLSNAHFSISFLASNYHMSESTLLRHLKKITGFSPKKYVDEIRLNKAREIILNDKYKTITEVSYEVGYRDATSLSRSFKKRFGKSPSEFG